MANKFTEEEFQRMVSMENIYVKTDLEYQREALRNPLTREWAHDMFVKKEKMYYWTIKIGNKKIRLYKGALDETIKSYAIGIEASKGTDEELTESEVRACGYRLDLFDKEEV